MCHTYIEEYCICKAVCNGCKKAGCKGLFMCVYVLYIYYIRWCFWWYHIKECKISVIVVVSGGSSSSICVRFEKERKIHIHHTSSHYILPLR
jgi:hypothetical protein